MNSYLLTLCFVLISFSASSTDKKKILTENSCDSIYVSKSERTLTLYSNGQAVQSFTVSIGYNPIGHKQKQGDNRTPEGLYYITDKNPGSAYYKNLGISYPNEQDRLRARKLKVSPGGDIKIHGYSDAKGSCKERLTRYAYTWGCIGVSNEDMDVIYRLVKVGSSIKIEP